MAEIKKYTAPELIKRLTSLGFKSNGFNLIGVRSTASIPNKFDDDLYVINNNQIVVGPVTCTTNPGKDYLLAPLNPKGAAVLVADKQYVDCFQLGLHKGKNAIIQCGSLLVFRDNDKDELSEEIGTPMVAGPECRIDIHQANESWTSVIIGKWSAGCQVVANPVDYLKVYTECKNSKLPKFTYTLLKEF